MKSQTHLAQKPSDFQKPWLLGNPSETQRYFSPVWYVLLGFAKSIPECAHKSVGQLVNMIVSVVSRSTPQNAIRAFCVDSLRGL